MKRVALVIVMLVCLTCSVYAERGQLLKYELTGKGEYTQEDYNKFLQSFANNDSVLRWARSCFGTSGCNVQAYRIVYTSIDHTQQETPVSGVVLVPRISRAILPLLIYQHATIIENRNAVSFVDKSNQTMMLMASFAANGYVVALSDYVGLGTETTKREEYLYAASEAANGADIYIASRELLAKLNISSGNLYVAGYSQGGQAAAALARLLQEQYPQYPVSGACFMEGPYNMTEMMNHLLRPAGVRFGFLSIGTIIAAKAVYSLNNIYKWHPLDGVFSASYGELVERDFSNPDPGIFDLLFRYPADARKIFQPQFIKSALNGAIGIDIAGNNTDNWAPNMPTIISTSKVDTLIPASIAESAYQNMRALDGNVHLQYSYYNYDHLQNFFPSIVQAYNNIRVLQALN